MENQYISTVEAAKLLGVSRVAIFKQIKGGKLKAKKVGRSFVIDRRDLFGSSGGSLTEARKKLIEEAVDKAVREYGETFKLLGQE